jgi:hypothetical protein
MAKDVVYWVLEIVRTSPVQQIIHGGRTQESNAKTCSLGEGLLKGNKPLSALYVSLLKWETDVDVLIQIAFANASRINLRINQSCA